MDLFKALTGKNPAEYENAARILIDTPDISLFKKLVEQDDFLFDFIKNNVANRIKKAVTKKNYINLLEFFDYYSPSYDSVFAELLWDFGKEDIFNKIKDLFLNGNINQKTYAVKIFNHADNKMLIPFINDIRKGANSENEAFAANCTEVLAKMRDEVSKQEAINKLYSKDEFEAYNGIKFLVSYGAKDTLDDIIKVMKKSSLAENIASEIPFLIQLEDLLEQNYESGILVLCNIINAIPEIIPPQTVVEYNLQEILENICFADLTPPSALLLRMAKDKFESLTENDEYLFDCDKNTKDTIYNICSFLAKTDVNKLNNLIYEELYEESDFVLYAIDYIDDIEELETLLDSTNPTLVLKTLSLLKEKQLLTETHKELALSNLTKPELKQIVEVL